MEIAHFISQGNHKDRSSQLLVAATFFWLLILPSFMALTNSSRLPIWSPELFRASPLSFSIFTYSAFSTLPADSALPTSASFIGHQPAKKRFRPQNCNSYYERSYFLKFEYLEVGPQTIYKKWLIGLQRSIRSPFTDMSSPIQISLYAAQMLSESNPYSL